MNKAWLLRSSPSIGKKSSTARLPNPCRKACRNRPTEGGHPSYTTRHAQNATHHQQKFPVPPVHPPAKTEHTSEPSRDSRGALGASMASHEFSCASSHTAVKRACVAAQDAGGSTHTLQTLVTLQFLSWTASPRLSQSSPCPGASANRLAAQLSATARQPRELKGKPQVSFVGAVIKDTFRNSKQNEHPALRYIAQIEHHATCVPLDLDHPPRSLTIRTFHHRRFRKARHAFPATGATART